ncbi:DNA topoisomerase IV subunit B [Nisaea nitritireducens]|uniref:DNA topoisomerase IV subunit B n=1 Tax=Nisaea nitritireducens TaxID=568392 RepID=UPI001868D8CA|nr:DNA topoisomerase IV subunit B [Nisaea nitritireducens]
MSDLFQSNAARSDDDYSAKDIEVLEGLEPVRRRPGMYIGGTDERAMHHLVAEVLDNSMDEAVAGFASRIEIDLNADMTVTIRDNGRGIPVDPHPKFKDKSALEVILSTLHAGGKFSDKVYSTSGGLHGVGISVVNALSDVMEVEVARDKQLYVQRFSRGITQGPLESKGPVQNRRGTTVRFHPDEEIFGKARFRPAQLYRLARSKAYLFKGVEIRWSCDTALIGEGDGTPTAATLHYPGGLADFLNSTLGDRVLIGEAFAGDKEEGATRERVEWAVTWPDDRDDGFMNAYCNTIPTPSGGTHEAGLRTALLRGIRAYAEMVGGQKKAAQITAEDVMGGACIMLSVFVRDPQFQGQTKERLVSAHASKLVEQAVKDRFDHWLSASPEISNQLLERITERADDRQRRRQQKEVSRKTATRKLRLPGKLADCSKSEQESTEIFLVEGDSAGGSAKQARNRATQAILPLRGKILNVASASTEKLRGNQELSDISLALGCGTGDRYDEDQLRYGKVIIMTDADVDGAHIASLLMTYFFREMPKLVEQGHLYLALPPLYRLTQGTKSVYARDDAHREELIRTEMTGRAKIEVSRFKGLGEMPPKQLKETTMDPEKRILLRVAVPPALKGLDPESEDAEARRALEQTVETLMGRKPELRFQFIQENAKFVTDIDV